MVACHVAGGFEEAVLAFPGTQELWLGTRGGFIKLAMQYGYDIVPVYSFGEADLASQARCCLRRRAKFAGSTKIPMICPTEMGIRAKAVASVVGPPFEVPQFERPTRQQVEKCRVAFVSHLRALYRRHRSAHGLSDVPLVIRG